MLPPTPSFQAITMSFEDPTTLLFFSNSKRTNAELRPPRRNSSLVPGPFLLLGFAPASGYRPFHRC